MKILMISLFFFVPNLYAESFKVAGELLQFEVHKSGLLLKDCKKKCEALKVLSIKKYKASSIIKPGEAVGSYGSEACAKLLGGDSVLGVNMEGDGRDFCFFKDESMIEMNSLSKFLEKEKILKE